MLEPTPIAALPPRASLNASRVFSPRPRACLQPILRANGEATTEDTKDTEVSLGNSSRSLARGTPKQVCASFVSFAVFVVASPSIAPPVHPHSPRLRHGGRTTPPCLLASCISVDGG